jgi:hypothetical protein
MIARAGQHSAPTMWRSTAIVACDADVKQANTRCGAVERIINGRGFVTHP